MSNKIALPTIHLNGTSKAELVKQVETAYVALNEAVEALRAMAPHGRDYYVQPDSFAFINASHQARNREIALLAVLSDLHKIYEGIEDQGN